MNRSARFHRPLLVIAAVAAVASLRSPSAVAELTRLESPAMLVEVNGKTGSWSLLDKAAGVRWPTAGTATADPAVAFELADEGRSLVLRCKGPEPAELRLFGDALTVTDREHGGVLVPCREGLLIPADSGVAFQHDFGTSEYEGCHMNMLGHRQAAARIARHLGRRLRLARGPKRAAHAASRTASGSPRPLSAAAVRPASLRLTPLGKGDWNTVAAGYRRMAEQKGLAVTLRREDPPQSARRACWSARPT